MIRLFLSILGLIVGIVFLAIGVIPNSVAGMTAFVLIVVCSIYIVYFFVKKRQTQKVRPLRGEQGVSTTSRVFLVLSALGVVIGCSLVFFHFFAGYGFLIGIILMVISAIYVVWFLVTKAQTQKVKGFPADTRTVQWKFPISEQFQRGDWKIEQEHENRFHIYRYDGTQWQHRYFADREAATNFVDENVTSLGIDSKGNTYWRPKK